ncbi:O-antigen ligase family protein [bacterium]|nr:O-antigen ligase family protein [bacterium]
MARDAIFAVIAGLLLQSGDALRKVVWVLVLGAGALGAVSTFQFLTGSFGSSFLGFAQASVENIVGATDDYRISGPVGDPNFFAQWLVMVVPLAIDRFRSETSPALKAIAGGAALVISSAIVFTFSRGAVLGLAVVGAILLIAKPPKMRTVVTVAIAGILVLPILPPGYVERITTLGQVGTVEAGTDASIRGRTAEMKAGISMFEDHPFTGVGFGNYASNYVEYARQIGIEQRSEAREAHSLYLEVAAETGIPGMFAFAAIILVAGRSVLAARRRLLAGGRDDLAGICLALTASLAGYLITSVFLHMAFARPFWMIIGICLALPAVARAEVPDRDVMPMEAAVPA